MIELKPESCPGCGSERVGVLSTLSWSNDTYYYIKCRCCGNSSQPYKIKELAILIWNRKLKIKDLYKDTDVDGTTMSGGVFFTHKYVADKEASHERD